MSVAEHIEDPSVVEEPLPLSFEQITAANLSRVARWHPGFPDGNWNGADWSNAMGGECGEAQNVVKKLRRLETASQDLSRNHTEEELLDKLEEECADVYLYMDLLIAKYGLDLRRGIRKKFNKVSEEQGFPERL